jgi:hypothetical protein
MVDSLLEAQTVRILEQVVLAVIAQLVEMDALKETVPELKMQSVISSLVLEYDSLMPKLWRGRLVRTGGSRQGAARSLRKKWSFRLTLANRSVIPLNYFPGCILSAGSALVRPIEQLYRQFCECSAKACEDEANRYQQHPELRDADYQLVRVLRERCRQWKRDIEKLDTAYRGRMA